MKHTRVYADSSRASGERLTSKAGSQADSSTVSTNGFSEAVSALSEPVIIKRRSARSQTPRRDQTAVHSVSATMARRRILELHTGTTCDATEFHFPRFLKKKNPKVSFHPLRIPMSIFACGDMIFGSPAAFAI